MITCSKCGRGYGTRHSVQGKDALVLRCCGTLQAYGKDAAYYVASEPPGEVVVACAICGAGLVRREAAPTLLLDPPDCHTCPADAQPPRPQVALRTPPAPSRLQPTPKASDLTASKKRSKR